MIVVIITSIVAILLALLAGYTEIKRGLKIAFILLGILACIHYNYGNDYAAYFDTWNVISRTSLSECFFGKASMFVGGVRPEVGWILLNKLFSFKYGFFLLVACISIFENTIYYYFIKNLVSRKWWWLATFIYLINYRYYVLNFSMLRQGLVICIGILSFYYLEKKNYIKFIILMIIGCSIHTSAIVLIPVFFISKLGSNNTRLCSKILLIVTAVLFGVSNMAYYVFDSIIEYSVFSKYKELYVGWTASSSYGVGFFLITIQYILMLYFLYYNHNAYNVSKKEKTIILIAYFAFLLKPFEVIGAALITRLGFYYSVFDIVALPLIYNKLKSQLVKVSLMLILVTLTLYTYIGFWASPVYREPYSVFHTILEAF